MTTCYDDIFGQEIRTTRCRVDRCPTDVFPYPPPPHLSDHFALHAKPCTLMKRRPRVRPGDEVPVEVVVERAPSPIAVAPPSPREEEEASEHTESSAVEASADDVVQAAVSAAITQLRYARVSRCVCVRERETHPCVASPGPYRHEQAQMEAEGAAHAVHASMATRTDLEWPGIEHHPEYKDEQTLSLHACQMYLRELRQREGVLLEEMRVEQELAKSKRVANKKGRRR
jgi:hypothetical protein